LRDPAAEKRRWRNVGGMGALQLARSWYRSFVPRAGSCRQRQTESLFNIQS
jgi:hypothetical protein